MYSDWDSWIQEGIVDFAAPMTYFNLSTRLADYTNWMNFQKDRKGNRLMVTDAGTYLNTLQNAIDMLNMTRDPSPAGNYGDGFGAYSYQSPYIQDGVYGSWSTFSTELLAQVTPTWADIPDMPWKSSPTKGHIGGTITSPPSGSWADGAQVTVTGPETRFIVCDGTGFYAFIDLSPGTYTISASYGAYSEHKTVTVTAGAIADGDMALSSTDPTPPVISSVVVSNVTDGTANVTWLTDEAATSQVEYDFVPYYGQCSTQDPSMLTAHSVTLQGLTPDTTYHFRVRSTNAANLTTWSGDYEFTTQTVATTIIVDDEDSDCTLSGWIRSSSVAGWNDSYVYKNGVGSSTATWAPTFPRSGPYDVSLYYVSGANRTVGAPFTINCATGASLISVNQQTHGSAWYLIGSGLQFTAGKSGNVTLTNQMSDTTKNAIADAVKFEYQGDLTPPIMSAVRDDKYTTSTTSLQASWSGSDAQSGVTLYRYAVGTEPGMADVRPWTDAGTATSATIGGMSLSVGSAYYVSVRAVNAAGLVSAPMTSDGVTVARTVASVVEAKDLADGQVLCFPASSVTARFPTKFYIEDSNRVSGIRVEASATLSANQRAQVFGVLGLADGCERAITDCMVVPGTAGPIVRPLAMVTKTAGGVGLNNVGLLVRVVGKVKSVVSDGFYLDDGCKVTDETSNTGIKVWTGTVGSATVGATLGVTGTVSQRSASGKVYPMILMREMNPL